MMDGRTKVGWRKALVSGRMKREEFMMGSAVVYGQRAVSTGQLALKSRYTWN